MRSTKVNTNLRDTSVKAFLRWAGGKQKIVKSLLPFVPKPEQYSRYYEVFFGGGSLFFAIQPRDAVLADINADLMNCYRQVARSPIRVAHLVQQYVKQDSADFFYRVRAIEKDNLTRIEQAARFIYLNKAAFNGIYRVNRKGQFNVPYGPTSDKPAVPSEVLLRSVAKCLRKAQLLHGDFEEILIQARKGDFVYLDPPYPPRSGTAYFTHYSAERFNWEQQLRVARVFNDLADRGCLVMLSNADQIKVRNLYPDFTIHRLSTLRWLGSNGDRFSVREIVVTNYDPKEVC